MSRIDLVHFFQNLGDKLIYDDIEIEAQLTFN